MSAILYYFHDPMCSWCYAFKPALEKIRAQLPPGVEQLDILGGLAADDDTPMPASMQQLIRGHWQRIEQVVPGTRFNYDFWIECQPRRSTWPACRAVIAAETQVEGCGRRMVDAIQQAYYLEAGNPSAYATLIELAGQLDLDAARFETDIHSANTETELRRQVELTWSFEVRGFPSLVLVKDDVRHALPIDYNDAGVSLAALNTLL